MTDADTDPVATFRARLQDLYVQVRRPTYRSLEAHADRDGRALRTSTIGSLLNGPGTPRWDTVETFVRACIRSAQARQVQLGPALVDLDGWHAEYRAMENAVADLADARERIAGRPVPTGRRRRLAVPAQLPADLPRFTGRADHLAQLDKLLPEHQHPGGGGQPTAVVISAIAGTAGVGKTALAVHWAHRVRDRFPDGQLYVNLRGFDPAARPWTRPRPCAASWTRSASRPSGSRPTRTPRPPCTAACWPAGGCWSCWTTPATAEQVRPLLPGTPGCLVLVTSRNQLTGLVAADGAHPLTLDLLTPDEARELLARRLGADRVAAEPDAVDEIDHRVRPAAARPGHRGRPRRRATPAHSRSPRSPASCATPGTAGRARRRRPATDVRAVFSWSYQALTPPPPGCSGCSACTPAPTSAYPAAASLAGLPRATRPAPCWPS